MKRVEIEWTDSCNVALGWDDIEHYRKRHRPDLIHSVGFLIDETPESVMLCLNWTPMADNPQRDAESVNDAMVIPRSAIRSMSELRRR